MIHWLSTAPLLLQCSQYKCFPGTSQTVLVRQYTQLERTCLTDVPSAYRITVALSKRQVAAVTPEPVASSQTNVREQSRVGYYNGNIITFYRV